MNLEEMKRLKKECGLSNEQICEWSGVPLGTVRKIFSGETKRPRYETMQALEKFFTGPRLPNYPGPVYDFYPDKPPVLVKEHDLTESYTAFRNGEHTAEDLDRLRGDNGLGELIDGVLFNMAAPPVDHQIIVSDIEFQLRSHIREADVKCMPLSSPVDVHIEKNDKTVLQPDAMVICNKDLIRDSVIWGAPDFVVEVLSKSTRDNDFGAKYLKYRTFGVREYWIVDPFQKRVIVYDFEHDDLIHLYSFDDNVPVAIWNGECQIDFTQISKDLEEWT